MNKIQGCKATNKKSWIIVMLKTNLHHCSTWKSQNGQYTSRPDMNNWKWLVVTKMTFLRSTKVNIFSIAIVKMLRKLSQDIELLSLQRPMAERFLKWCHNSFQGIKSDDVMPHHTSSSLRRGLLSFLKQTKNYFYCCHIAEAIGLYACARWPPHHMTAVRPCPPCLCSNSEFRVYRYSVIVWSLFHSCLNLCYFILSGSEFL